MKGLTRRHLLRMAGGALAGPAALSLLRDLHGAAPGALTTQPANRPVGAGPIDLSEKSVVAHLRRREVIDGGRVHDALLSEMLEEGLALATGEPSGRDAWQRLLKPDDRIAIKFNQVGDDVLNTTTPVATALVESLGQAGFSPERIMLIEAPARLTRVLKTAPRLTGWSGGEVSFGSGSEELAAALQEVTAIVNVPFLKTHNIAGMTGCLKNLSHALVRRPGRYHANACSPFVGDIVALPQIRSKLRVHIVNALRAVYRGGPAATPENMWTHSGLIVSTDPVAADAVGIDLINEQRLEAKLPPIGDAQSRIPHVHAAAARGLGTDDLDYIHLIEPPAL